MKEFGRDNKLEKLYIYIEKLEYKYKSFLKEYRDILITRFKIMDLSDNIYLIPQFII